MITYPKYCDVCYETNPQKLVRCPGCKYSSVCREGECQAKMVADLDIHKKYCEDKKLAFLCHTDYAKEPIFTEMPQPLNFDEYLENNSKDCDLFTLMEFVSGKKFVKKPENRETFKSFATICHFSYTATLIFALKYAKLLTPDRKTLHLHIVGAQHEINFFTRDTCALFYVFMPKLESLKISFIGPSIPHPASFSCEIDCFDKTIEINYCKLYYEDFRGPRPDFIMCFNKHWTKHEWGDWLIPSKPTFLLPWTPDTSWVRGVRKILSYKVSFAFTNYKYTNLFLDSHFLNSVAHHKEIDVTQLYGNIAGVNDFRDSRPFLNHDKTYDEPLFYWNQYIFVLSWREASSETETEETMVNK